MEAVTATPKPANPILRSGHISTRHRSSCDLKLNLGDPCDRHAPKTEAERWEQPRFETRLLMLYLQKGTHHYQWPYGVVEQSISSVEEEALQIRCQPLLTL